MSPLESLDQFKAPEFMTRTLLGRYRILGELGRGAMGTVYRALDPLIERDVAIKTLHPDLPEEVLAEVRERFLREAKSAGRLSHPNIVTIFDVGEHDGVAYMAMELLEGRSLQQILSESKRLPLQTTISLVIQIADALDRAQQLGIVHRDVKPANVVVSDSGHAKLTDFGVAHVPSSTMTQTGAMIGSPRYMSPEQVLGLPVDPRSDIFSLGVMLYEMLTGRAPFTRPEDTTIFPLMHRIAGEPHPRVTQLDQSIPAVFDAILDKALAKKPADRYQRAGEMAKDLREPDSLRSAGAAPVPADDEKTMVLAHGWQAAQPEYVKTVVVPAGRPPSSSPPVAQNTGSELVMDLETFSRNYEAEEQARLRAEDEVRRKKAEELQRWSEAEERKRVAFEREGLGSGSAPAGAEQGRSRRGALDLLKKQTATRKPGEDSATIRARADAALDHDLRSAAKYLAEVAVELNGVDPASGRPYDYMFLGRLPTVTLGKASSDLGIRKVNGKDLGDHLFFRYRIQPEVPAKATLLGGDIGRCQEYFKPRDIPFESRIVEKNDFGQATRAVFTVSGSLPCEVNLRADYDNSSIEIELSNVRRPGRVRYRIEPGKLDDLVDDLARYILGIDDDFEQALKRP